VLAAANPAARALGLRRGQAHADARAILPALGSAPAEPDREQVLLRRLALWAERFSPLVGIDELKPMMIKEIAEEIGVHPSTVSRAVSSKYAHTPQGVFELRYFFSEAVQGPSGGGTPLLLLKRMVKKMIDEEDRSKPLTDEQITALLQNQGINVTRRTVAKYREDMKIPSTHQRRVRN